MRRACQSAMWAAGLLLTLASEGTLRDDLQGRTITRQTLVSGKGR
jgi:hypothetical protein